MAFDLAKSLVESVCKTILGDRGQTEIGNPDLPDLLNRTINCIPLIPNKPTDGESKTEKAVRNAVSGLNRIVNALAELRNEAGTIGHGRDLLDDSLDSIHAQLTAH